MELYLCYKTTVLHSKDRYASNLHLFWDHILFRIAHDTLEVCFLSVRILEFETHEELLKVCSDIAESHRSSITEYGMKSFICQ